MKVGDNVKWMHEYYGMTGTIIKVHKVGDTEYYDVEITNSKVLSKGSKMGAVMKHEVTVIR